ncbi:unknown [Ruminococcus sp. CAG:353]|nr:unknown [Ruminococcus sp. CAG:353]
MGKAVGVFDAEIKVIRHFGVAVHAVNGDAPVIIKAEMGKIRIGHICTAIKLLGSYFVDEALHTVAHSHIRIARVIAGAAPVVDFKIILGIAV